MTEAECMYSSGAADNEACTACPQPCHGFALSRGELLEMRDSLCIADRIRLNEAAIQQNMASVRANKSTAYTETSTAHLHPERSPISYFGINIY